jgi:non-canonical purine NTP pyrophosphatase (RdgB/HAM1 family)
MPDLTFITSNKEKFSYAKHALSGTKIDLKQQKFETPEIQSTDVCAIAGFSAKWAAEKLGEAVIVTDAGFYIQSLHGFPGPFVKYINHWLTAEDILCLMENKKIKKMEVKACLAYCCPGSEPKFFLSIIKGKLASQAVKMSSGSQMDRIFIPDGYTRPIGAYSYDEQRFFWSQAETFWPQLVTYLAKQK